MFMKNRLFKRVISTVLAGVMLAGSVVVSADRDFEKILEEARLRQSAGIMGGSIRTDLYMYYFEEHGDKTKPNHEIEIRLGEYVDVSDNEELKEGPDYSVEDFQGQSNCLIWNNDLGRFDYTFEVPETGIYNLEMLYYPRGGNNNAIEVALLINGEHPFSATRNLELDKYWRNEGEIQKDARDNQLLPRQVLYNGWINYRVKDKEGLFNEPYFFFLERGTNIVSIEGIKVNQVAFASMTFKNYPSLPKYADIRPSDADINATPGLRGVVTNDIGSNTILRQGESPYWRSSSELIPTYDRSTYQVSPSHPVKMRYNTVGGGGSWGKAGQSMTWEFNVPADGYYRFSAKVRQNTLRGFNANRRILINGEVPVQEFDKQKFGYSTRWYQQTLQDDEGNDIYIRLKEGLNYITMEAVPGDIGETMQRLEADLFTLNYYYRRILMITGPNPDEFNPYYVDKAIPELLDEFDRIRKRLREEKDHIEGLTRGSEAATLETMAVILDRMIASPDRIPQRMQSMKDNIGSLSAWIREQSRQPLEIDYIEIATVNESFGKARANFFRQLLFLWNGFIGSFFEDFTRLDDGDGLNVWVGLGRDQALSLKHLVDSDYNTVPGNHQVSINLVQGSILEATLAGKGPEVALFIGGDFPVQLAARGLTVDVSKFDNYQEIVDERFVHSLPTFFTYLDGVYGLPLTQQFPMMFYRTDILETLGLEPPRCWDEFTDAIAVLNRAYLGAGLVPPLNPAALNSQIFEPGETFTMLQLQTGNNFYRQNADGVFFETNFDTEESIQAFTTWTKFYTVYSFDQTFDSFNRFRTGEYPILIQPYGFFNQVNAAAPEIRGMWDFRHVPGTWRNVSEAWEHIDVDSLPDRRRRTVTDENDNRIEQYLDISASSGASCGLIFAKLSEADRLAAWDFLVWLTSDDTQTQFGQNMESMLGPLGRYDTANKNALANLAWTERQRRRLEEQRDAIVEIPMIPANYAATRHIKNAFRAVVNDHWFPRYSLNSYNRDINAEITRKNAELESHGRR
jgi:ABC-type glycerol-3-phosphate transport system substrate-binding protein